MNVGIYIYDNAEVLDFSGPFEVFSTASRVCEEDNPFSVFLIGNADRVVTARSGYQVIPSFGFENHPVVDVLIVTGGVHNDEIKKPDVIEWISLQAKTARITASVCTGAFLLAEAGLLKGKNVTTHWEDISALRSSYQEMSIRSYDPLGCPIRSGPPRAVVHNRQSHAESGTVKISRP